jgi:3-polyprenyl-4-hydroxybenzoate decarboxylase
MQDVRTFIKDVERETPKELIRFREEVDPYYEITAIVRKFDLAGHQPLIIFENVKGHEYPVVCNLEAGIPRLALAMKVSPDQIYDRYREIEDGVLSGKISYPPREIAPEDSPVKEVVIPRLEQEGPWRDFTRYSQVGQRHPVFITGITHRRDMIFPA